MRPVDVGKEAVVQLPCQDVKLSAGLVPAVDGQAVGQVEVGAGVEGEEGPLVQVDRAVGQAVEGLELSKWGIIKV